MEAALFLVVAAGAFGFSGYKVWQLLKLMKASKGRISRIDHLPARIKATIANVLGQQAVLRKRWIGILHTSIFWGFIIITVGTVEQFISTLFSGFSYEFIGDIPYAALVFIQDFFTALVLIAAVLAAYRRYIVRPKHLGQSTDAGIILVFTSALMIAILGMNAFMILGVHPHFADAMPFSNALASFLSDMVPNETTALTLSKVFKWIHMLIVLGFAMYIPSSKHLHVLAAGPNTFFQNLGREKGMKSINFDDATVTQYGAAKVTDLTWKDTLDYYSCTECGRCQEVCPAWNTEKPLSPKNIIHDLKLNLMANKAKILAGKADEVSHVIDTNVTEDVIWACTSCRACEVACPVFIEQTDKIYDIRRNLVMMESKFPEEVQTVFKNMETNATPWAFSADDRANWAQGLAIPTLAESPQFDVLLWVGCAGAYDERNTKVVKSFVNLLKKAQIRFAILGKEEKCTGDSARRIGNEYLFQNLAKANIETLNRYNVKKILTTCPHCFNTLKNEYKDFGGHYEVMHHATYLAQLIKEGKIRPTKNIEETVAYHDSCYIGRWNGIYDEPRHVLQALPAARLEELPMAREQSMCCGAGGGRMWMEEKIGKRINITRTEQALTKNPSVIAANCPFCMTMLNDGVKAKNMQDKVRVRDLAELIDEATP